MFLETSVSAGQADPWVLVRVVLEPFPLTLILLVVLCIVATAIAERQPEPDRPATGPEECRSALVPPAPGDFHERWLCTTHNAPMDSAEPGAFCYEREYLDAVTDGADACLITRSDGHGRGQEGWCLTHSSATSLDVRGTCPKALEND